MNDVSVEFRNVTISINDQLLFENFNLSVKKGEKIVIFGKSGLGKTTLFRMLLGFITPDKGEIYINGKEVNASHYTLLRQKIAYLPQNTNLGLELVKDFINMIFSFKNNISNKPINSKLIKLLEEYQLADKILEKPMNELSGGEKQRIFLIICCLQKKPIILLDEPTSSLDQDLKEIVKQKIIEMNQKTVLIISHDNSWKSVDSIRLINLNTINHGDKVKKGESIYE